MSPLPSLTPVSAKVVVTGAVGGVGSALMAALAQLNCSAIGIDLPDAVQSAPDRDRLIAADLSDAESASRAITSAVDRLAGLDCLVGAAAAVATLHRADSFPAAAFRDDVAANLLSQFWTAQAAYPALTASGAASVVMLSSIGALDGLPGQASYAASKAGILGLVRTLAAEWAHAGIRVNAIVPGLTATPKVLAMPEEIRRRAVANVALGRMTSVAEVVASIVFLLSPAGAAITGQSIRVDAGSGLNTTVGLHR
ncbi:SDR family oxidoreductase [Mycobacterium sp. Aquia_216]|uniref:SDR family NAD(P)-dependent oxidoreductase n=1 Tax=Mycobacterium sp. Aquia_216 TaxID=2991729 RepID=UPI00227A9010|nr:SDR family oxidoreductase [Mycobacterium sp. Aquia_216]WAJ43587.1 SDR family oxidoreductase [Mycobacterium sp. Aquia_216]